MRKLLCVVAMATQPIETITDILLYVDKCRSKALGNGLLMLVKKGMYV